MGRTAAPPGALGGADERPVSHLCKNHAMELTWYGRTCVRMRGKDAVVVADAYQSVVGPTGRGITGDIVTYSHPDDAPLAQGQGPRLARRRDACSRAASRTPSAWTGRASTR